METKEPLEKLRESKVAAQMTKEPVVAKVRREKILKWLKNPYNLALVGIILFALIIRIYYFIQTNDQTLWWDEAEYMATAKRWAFGVPYDLNPQRPPLFQALSALVFIIGLGENFIRFAFIILPSVFLVYAIYLLGKEMFNQKIALIAAFLATLSWTFLFWSMRVQPDFMSMVFQVLAVLFMWKHWKSKSTKNVILSGVFTAIGFYFKVSALLIPMSFIVFILIKERLYALNDKHNYYYAFSFIITLVPYFIWSYLTFHTPFGFTAGYIEPVAKSTPFGWYNINFYYSMTEGLVFILFILGLIYGLKFLLYADVLIKNKNKCFEPNLFSILVLLVVSAFYIFHIKNTDDRWVFLWMPFIFFLAGSSSILIHSLIKKYSKVFAAIVLIALLAFAGYSQYKHGDALIENKKDTYMPVKLGGIWVKENSNPEDKLASISYTQSTYYSERNVTSYSLFKDANEFNEFVNREKIRYLQVSLFEPHPNWIGEWINQNQNRLIPVKVYYADQQGTQASLVIYEIK